MATFILENIIMDDYKGMESISGKTQEQLTKEILKTE